MFVWEVLRKQLNRFFRLHKIPGLYSLAISSGANTKIEHRLKNSIAFVWNSFGFTDLSISKALVM